MAPAPWARAENVQAGRVQGPSMMMWAFLAWPLVTSFPSIGRRSFFYAGAIIDPINDALVMRDCPSVACEIGINTVGAGRCDKPTQPHFWDALH
jgi:hypothetical protein